MVQVTGMTAAKILEIEANANAAVAGNTQALLDLSAATEALLQATEDLRSQDTIIKARVALLESNVVIPPATPKAITTYSKTETVQGVTGTPVAAATQVPVVAGDTCVLVNIGFNDTSVSISAVTLNTPGTGTVVYSLVRKSGGDSTGATPSLGRSMDVWYKTGPAIGNYDLVFTHSTGVRQTHNVSVLSGTAITGDPLTALTITSGSSGTTASATAVAGGAINVAAVVARSTVIPSFTGTPVNLDVGLLGGTNTPIKAVYSETASSFTANWTTADVFVLIAYGVLAEAVVPTSTMPVGDITGWTQVVAIDFDTDVALGGFVNTGSGSALSAPAAYKNDLAAYPTTYDDTSNRGHYDPQQCMSVSDSALKIHMFYDTSNAWYAVAAPRLVRTFVYGRFEERFRVVNATSSFKVAWLMWPESIRPGQTKAWPAGGEIDYPEGDLTGNFGAFMHYANPLGGQDGFSTTVKIGDGEWHHTITEWYEIAGVPTCKFWLDDVLIGTAVKQVPATPWAMRRVYQCETRIGGSVNPIHTADLEIDWVVAYTRN